MDRIVEKVEFKTLQPEKLMRVAAYGRVSGGKDMQLHSLSAQVSYYSRLIQQHKGWVYCGVYSDEAITGTKANRDAFQKMLTDCRAGKIDMIITKTVSRFARNTVTTIAVIRELKAQGIDVYFEKEKLHTLGPDGEFVLTLLASYAQEESRSASENQKWRIRKSYKDGEIMNWRFQFGYTITADSITVNEAEAEILRELFRRFNDGESMESLVRDMNRREVPLPLGGKWKSNSMRRILSNEKYIGDALLQKTFVNNHLEKKKIENVGQLPKYYISNTHPPIIDKETFQKAQERLAAIEAVTKERKPPKRGPFHGMIVCKRCGVSYSSVHNNGSFGYNCTTYTHKGKEFCHGKKIPLDTLIKETNSVLGLTTFDEKVFKARISHIIVPEPNHLIYVFKDGHEEERVWKDRSRRESWTPEMKEQARQRTIKQNEEAKNARAKRDTEH